MKKMLGCLVACAALSVMSVSAAESCESTDLIHRWSFNGSLADACGGNTARFDGAGKIVDWTGRAPANLADMKFTLDAASRRRGRRLIVKADGLYVEGGFILFVR